MNWPRLLPQRRTPREPQARHLIAVIIATDGATGPMARPWGRARPPGGPSRGTYSDHGPPGGRALPTAGPGMVRDEIANDSSGRPLPRGEPDSAGQRDEPDAAERKSEV